MIKIHCDLCDGVVNEDNLIEIIWKDNNGLSIDNYGVFRCKRKMKAQICNKCIEKLRTAIKEKGKND